jgi:hypothetical protein
MEGKIIETGDEGIIFKEIIPSNLHIENFLYTHMIYESMGYNVKPNSVEQRRNIWTLAWMLSIG